MNFVSLMALFSIKIRCQISQIWEDMSGPEILIQVLRSEIRAANMTYKQLAKRLDMSESSVKRVFLQGDMSLSGLEQICKAVGVSMEDVLCPAADCAPHADTLTLDQERSLVRDPKLLQGLRSWEFAQFTAMRR